MNVRNMMSSDKMDWETPQWFVDSLGKFDLDACAYDSTAKAEKWYTEADNALMQEWHGRVWMNPPYGRELPVWLDKALHESKQEHCKEVVCLVPARTDTKWFHEIACKGNIALLKGRIRFLQDGKDIGSPAFPSMLVVFNKHKKPSISVTNLPTKLNTKE